MNPKENNPCMRVDVLRCGKGKQLSKEEPVHTIPGIPYDWSILTVRQSFAFLRTDSNKHVEHVKPSYTSPFDVLTFKILSPETVFQEVGVLEYWKRWLQAAPFFLPTFFRSFAILLLAHFFPRAYWPKVWHKLGTHILSGSNSGLFSFYVVAPNWSNWGSWITCSATCGRGIRTRVRRCNNPPPPAGNVYCVGLPVQTEGCTVRDCPSKPRCTVMYRFTQG